MSISGTRRGRLLPIPFEVAALCCVLANFCGCNLEQPALPGKFAHHFYHYQIEVELDRPWYIVYVPDSYESDVPTPMILYWHGRGQAGRDGYAPITRALGVALQLHPDLYPCLVALPQLPWSSSNDKDEAIFDAVLDEMQRDYNVDPDRIYVSGASEGSQRAFRYVAARPGKFAGMFSVAGPVGVEYAAELRDVPTYIGHGDEDGVYPVQESRDLADAIARAGGTVLYEEFKGGGHDIFTEAYSDPTNVNWLLSQHLGQ